VTDSTKPGAGAVTREIRAEAARVVAPGIGDIERDWIEHGDAGVGYIPIIMSRVAQSLANAFEVGQRSRDAEVERLRSELADAKAVSVTDEQLAAARDDVSYLRRDYAHDSEEHQQMFDRITAALARGGK